MYETDRSLYPTPNLGRRNLTLDELLLSSGPAGFWKLNETSGTTAVDSSGNGNHGTYHGSPALATRSLGGNFTGLFANFDGVDDYVSIPPMTAPPTTQVTFEVWTIVDTTPEYAGLMSELYSADAIMFELGLDPLASGSVNTSLASLVYSTGGQQVNYPIGPPPTGTLTQIAGTSDGTTQKLYVNGELVNSGSATEMVPSNSGWLIGRRHDTFGGTPYWDGVIGNSLIYNRLLSAPELEEHYLAGIS